MAKRPAAAAPFDTAEQSKRYRSAIDESLEEFLCPITQELPVDPVMADDGKVYERAAIERWLERHTTSPATNQRMGKKLLPALQVKNMLRSMVKSGAVVGDKADALRKRLEEDEVVKQAKHQALAGDAAVALQLAFWCSKGEMGLPKDSVLSFKYTRMAVDVPNPNAEAMRTLAEDYLCGRGTDTNIALGLYFMSRAAEVGSRRACFRLGRMFGEVTSVPSAPKDEALAHRYFSRMNGCTDDGKVDDADMQRASEWLRDHPAKAVKEPVNVAPAPMRFVSANVRLAGYELQRAIIEFLKQEGPFSGDNGVGCAQMGAGLEGTPLADIKDCLAHLLEEGDVYSTIDDDHYLAI